MALDKKQTTGRRYWRNSPAAGKTHGSTASMGAKEKQMLAIAAGVAFKHQASLGRVEPGQSEDEWRHEQVQDTVGKPGLRACTHGDFRPLLAWFQQLAGLEAEAVATRLRTGRVKDHGPAGDTHEARGKIVAEIRGRLTAHILLADLTWSELLDRWTSASKSAWAAGDEFLAEPAAAVPGQDPWPGLDSKWLAKAMDRKIHMEAAGPIREGYLIALARGKTGRPDLDLGRDLWAGLEERCTLKQLTDLLSTLVNRINAREGISASGRRNRKQASDAEKRRRSKHEIDTPPVSDPFEQLRRDRGA